MNETEVLEVLRAWVKADPEAVVQVLARLVTRFEVHLVVHRREGEAEIERWSVTVGEVEGPEPEVN